MKERIAFKKCSIILKHVPTCRLYAKFNIKDAVSLHCLTTGIVYYCTFNLAFNKF